MGCAAQPNSSMPKVSRSDETELYMPISPLNVNVDGIPTAVRDGESCEDRHPPSSAVPTLFCRVGLSSAEKAVLRAKTWPDRRNRQGVAKTSWILRSIARISPRLRLAKVRTSATFFLGFGLLCGCGSRCWMVLSAPVAQRGMATACRSVVRAPRRCGAASDGRLLLDPAPQKMLDGLPGSLIVRPRPVGLSRSTASS